MNDCPNADVRDLLPDLVHGRLDEATRAMVESHLSRCADCRAELALLRALRASMGGAPALNLSAIAAAVPVYRAPVRRSWVGWRTAAAVTLIVAGGSSIVVTQRLGKGANSVVVDATPIEPAHEATTAPSAVNVTPPRSAPPAVAAVPSPPDPRVARVMPQPVERELAMSGGTLTDLSDRELASLLKEIESLDALPSTDVESGATSPIAPRRGGP